MLRIRQEQWDVFGQVSAQRFEAELVQNLGRAYPESAAGLGAQGLEELVSLGVGRGLELGVLREHDLARFVGLYLALGPDFESSGSPAWVAELLVDEARGWSDRLDEIYRHPNLDRGN